MESSGSGGLTAGDDLLTGKCGWPLNEPAELLMLDLLCLR